MMRSNILFLCSLFIFIAVGQVSYGQEAIKDTTVIEKNGRKYYRYVVEPGNTLYSISRQYGISVTDIQEHNSNTKGGLSIGDTLFILAAKKDKGVIEKKMEVDGDIIVHEVQKKQTLYAISKIYGISVSDIMAVNPDLKKGLKDGQLIRIPIAKLKKEEIDPVLPEGNYTLHKVESKETLYSLSKLYNVPVDSIEQANNGLPEGLKVGQLLMIPKLDLPINAPDTSLMKDSYNVAFILPFFLDLNDTLISKLKIDDKETVLSKSNVTLQFYEGALMAIDSLKDLDVKFDIRVYDSAKDSNVVNNILNNGKLEDVDLIIGPMYLSQFLKVSKYAKEHKIHIVCPVPQNNKVLLGNDFVSKVATSRNIIFKNLGRYISNLYRTENIIIIGQNFRANPLSFAFKTEFLNALEKTGDTVSIKNLKEVKWDDGSIDVITRELIDTGINVILIPSSDQVYVTQLLAKLNNIHEDYHFKVIGVDKWLRYTNVDFNYFQNLGVMIPVDGYIDYKRPEVQSFISKYQEKNKIFPEKFAFQGFDVTHFYLNMLKDHGTRFEPALIEANSNYLYFKFGFFKTGIESGYENKSTFLLKYEEFELKEVPVFD